MKHALIIVLLVWVSAVFADPRTWNPQGLPVRVGQNITWAGSASAQPDGSSLVVWSDTRSTRAIIYAQLIDPLTGPVWQEEGIPVCSVDSSRILPVVSALEDGWLIAWWDRRLGFCDADDMDQADIYAQKLSLDGQCLWDVVGVRVSELTEDISETPIRLMANPEGGAYVVWGAGFMMTEGNYEPRIQSVDGSGNVLWEHPLYFNALTDTVQVSGFATDAQRNLLVLGELYGSDVNEFRVWKYHPDGTFMWAERGAYVCVSHFPIIRTIVGNYDGGCTVAWGESDPNILRAQRLDSEGTRLWDSSGVIVAVSYGERAQLIGADSSAIMVWSDGAAGVFAQKLESDGERLWSLQGLRFSGSGSNTDHILATLPSADGVITLWGSNGRLFANRANGNGEVLWGENGIQLTEEGTRYAASGSLTPAPQDVISLFCFRENPSLLGIRWNTLALTDGELQHGMEGEVIVEGLRSAGRGGQMVPLGEQRVGFAWTELRDGVQSFFQIVDSDGVSLMPDQGQLLFTAPIAGSWWEPSYLDVCSDANGGFYAAFGADSQTPLLIQHLDSDGQPSCDLDGVEVYPTVSMDYSLHLATDGMGGCYVYWDMVDLEYNEYRYLQHINELCETSWTQPLHLPSGPFGSGEIELCTTSDGHCLIVEHPWNDTNNPVVLTRIGLTGQIIRTDTLLLANFYQLVWASDETGGVFLASAFYDSTGSTNLQIQFINPDGQLRFEPPGQPFITTPGWESPILLLTEADGGWYQIWLGETGYFVNRFDANAQPVWESVPIPVQTTWGMGVDFAAKVDEDNGLFIVWTDYRTGTADLYGLHLDQWGVPSADPYWDLNEGGPVCTAIGAQIIPKIEANGSGGFVVDWMDSRYNDCSGNNDLYAQRIRDLMTSVHRPNDRLPTQFALIANYPNPFNPVTEIRFDLPRETAVELSVYDVTGRLVQTLINQSERAGTHSTRFDAAGLASGIYFYRLRAADYEATRKMILIR